MLFVNWQLTLLFLTAAPVMAVFVKFASRKTRGLSHKVQNLMGDVTHIAEEGIEAYREVRIYGGQDYEMQKFTDAVAANRRREMQTTAVNALISPVVQMIAGAMIIFMIYLASTHITNISPGGFAAVVVSMLLLLKPIKSLAQVNATIQKGIAAAESIFQLLDTPAEQNPGQLQNPRVRGEIVFTDVGLSYDEQHPVLQHINLAIQPGQTLALVGKSGSGKSSLISLLPRFYELSHGHITIDGVDISEFDLLNLRQQFALVSQNIVLFNDTIEHNITYGCSQPVSQQRLIEVAKAAHAYEFIQALPQGFATPVGEKGLRLSGGQKQRIAIARAILKDAPILILDEATSSLDTESERHIQAALDNLMQHRTTIVIAHRLSTIENADQIVVLDRGHIVEQGTHQSLLQNNQYYAKLHAMQFNSTPIETSITET
jgi:subfamily B ATP-binding cassette protein MsbA